MSRNPYVIPAGAVVLPAHMAERVSALLGEGVRAHRAAGYRLPDDVAQWIEAVQQVSNTRPPADPPLVVSTEARWIPTAEVARVLGISDRAVRKLRLPSRKVAGNLMFDEAEVFNERDARTEAGEPCGTLRNPAA